MLKLIKRDDKMNNPFNPSFGRVPSIFLNRGQLINDVLGELDNPDSPYKVSIVYGMRGVGKTTFLTEILIECQALL